MKQKKKAAIYDRWLSSLGGGEQVAFAYARALANLGYEVDLLTHTPVNITKASEKMGFSFEGTKLKYLKNSSTGFLSKQSEKYDIFINTSHLDYFANRSQNGLLSVFFPAIVKLTLVEYLKRALFVPSFRSFFIYPLRYEDFLYDEHIDGKIYKWMTNSSSIVFKKNVEFFSIKLYFDTFANSVIDSLEYFADGKQVYPLSTYFSETENCLDVSFSIQSKFNYRFTVNTPGHNYIQKVALLRLTIPGLRYFLYNYFKLFFPLWEMRLHGGPGITKIADLRSYRKIITISDFCKLWIKKYWGLESEVLYPPVNTSNFFAAKKKKNIILHVGRFFVTGHSKKQLQLAEAFNKLVNKHNIDNWELHFVGSIEEGYSHKKYFEKVQKVSQGQKVFFHTNLTFKDLRILFSQAKIYWHATGLDEEENNPIAFEHFGITTVEAMASGCVPVVFRAGGQAEIVTKECGFSWRTREQLIDITLQLINNPDLLKKYSKQAIQRSTFFDTKNFTKKFRLLIS